MSTGFGPFHSLSDRDIAELSELIGSGRSVRQAAMLIGAHYGHCLNYAHGLISSRLAKKPTPQQYQRFLALLAKQTSSIHHCAHVVGISVSVGYRIAVTHGYYRKRSRTQQRIDQTNLRLDYLRLRLGSLSRRDAATAVGVSRRCATDFDKGLTLGHFTMAANVPIYFCPRLTVGERNKRKHQRQTPKKPSEIQRPIKIQCRRPRNHRQHPHPQTKKNTWMATPPKSWPTRYTTKVALLTNNPPVATTPRIHPPTLA